jgi:hypothetical protein
MKLGFIIGAVLATWLTLTYPDQMRIAFNKAMAYVESSMTFFNS